VSSGAESDLKRATDIAFKMVAHYGMSPKIGPVYHEHRSEHPFLGQMLATEGQTSDATVSLIESEARRVLADALSAAQKLLAGQRSALDRLVKELLERETIERDELLGLLGPGAPRAHPGVEPIVAH
jgi:cell division protease FtsH